MDNSSTIIFLSITGLLIIFLFVYVIMRSLLMKQRRLSDAKSGPEAKKRDDIGFVVDTFHELVRKLKDKEEELQKLRVIAEEKAESIESYNENILRSISSGVITFDKDGRIMTFNPAAGQILSKNAEDIIGKTCTEVFGENSPITKVQRESIIKEEGIPRLEANLKTSQGDSIWLGMNTSLLRNRDNETIGLILVFSDLTEIKYLQEQIELKERFTLLGEMSAGIAHELRNPMGAISGFAKLLSKKLAEGDGRKSLVEAIEKEIEGMNRVITELLNFTKPADLNLTDVSIKDLIEDSLKTVQMNGMDIKLDLGRAPVIEADEVLLKQAFINIFQNSIEAMPAGGELKISTHIASQRPVVEIEISDTGIGIPEDKLNRIFQPFFTTKERGTGLGLSLVKKIVLYHGGYIEVKSKEGKGTTFKINLPVRHQRDNI